MITGQQLLDSLIEERGGISRFSTVQVQIARVIAKLMGEMGDAKGGDVSRIASTMVALLAQLPPIKLQPPEMRPFPKGMTLIEMAAAYERMLKGDPNYIDWDAVDAAPTIDLQLAPGAPAEVAGVSEAASCPPPYSPAQ